MQNTDPRSLLLDTKAEATFDRLTFLASQFLDVPVTLISILDVNRQFFKSQCGLDEPYATTRETPLSHSFCKHVVALAEPLMVNDARVHPLVRENRAIADLGVIAYLGVPLFDETGAAYGALCAIDGKPRQWTPKDVGVLKALAAQVMSEVSLQSLLTQQTRELTEALQFGQNLAYFTRADRHDLRTPLNGLLMSLQAMEALGELDDEQIEFLQMAKRSGKELAAMIDKMLDIGAVDARGNVALSEESVSPSELVTRAVEQVAPLARGKAQALQCSAELVRQIPADAEKLVRVLVNLLGNAIKFTPEGGRIAVTVDECVEEGRSAVLFAVSDSGIGIDETHLCRIFIEGFRVDRNAPTERSTGLGLTFCKRIVEAHRGRIWVESRLGEGSTFRFVIPIGNSV